MSSTTTPPPTDRFTSILLHPSSIDSLLTTYQSQIKTIHQQITLKLQAATNNEKIIETAKLAPLDEIYILRFILSHPEKIEDAMNDLWTTLLWRSEHLSDLLAAQQGNVKYRVDMNKYASIHFLGYLGGLHPVIAVRAGKSKPGEMFEHFTQEQILENSLYGNEHTYHLCDLKTRETRMLCKVITIIDLQGFSLKNLDRRLPKFYGQASQLSQIYYPQLLGRTVMTNMPSFFRIIFKALRLFWPAKTVEKQAICPADTGKKSAKDCPFLSKFSPGPELLPPFLGGTGPDV
jgi:hypothetical protein